MEVGHIEMRFHPRDLHRSKIVPLANGRKKMHVSRVSLEQMLTAATGIVALMAALLCPAQQLTNDRLSASVGTQWRQTLNRDCSI
jgi:hypothetical protein